MNAQPNTTEPNLDGNLPAPSSPAPEQDSRNGNVSPPVAGHYHRGNGKITQLPKPLSLTLHASASHCDIAWAGALATEANKANNWRRPQVGAAVLHEHGVVIYEAGESQSQSQREMKRMILSDDPAIWKPFNF